MLDVHKVATQERRAVLQQSLRPPVIEEFMFRGSYTMEECVICFEEVKLRKTNCNHTFCEECLVKYVQAWVVNGQRMAKCPLRCPVCSVGLAPFDVPARVRHLMVWRELVQPATAATAIAAAAVAAGGGGGGHGPLQPPPSLERKRLELSLKACVCCCVS